MKREDVINVIAWIVHDHDPNDGNQQTIALRVLSYLEDIGMLPPTCTVTTKDGKHTPSERRWDDETE